MCLSGACDDVSDDHGDNRNITLDDIKNAAKTIPGMGSSPDDIVNNIIETWESRLSSREKFDLESSQDLTDAEHLYGGV